MNIYYDKCLLVFHRSYSIKRRVLKKRRVPKMEFVNKPLKFLLNV